MHPTHAKLAEDRTTAHTLSGNNTFMETSSVALPAFSLLLIILNFLTFTLKPFESNAPF